MTRDRTYHYFKSLENRDRLHPIADRQIAFDLDDGVLVNYAKFGGILAKLK